MAVNVETPLAASTANGSTTSFPYSFTVLNSGDLVVTGTLSGVTTTYQLGVDYTLTGVGTNAGSVEFVTAPANGTLIVRYRDTDLSRETDYQNNGDLLAETLNTDLDRLYLLMQEIFGGGKGVVNALRVPNGESIPALGDAAARASRVLAFDSDGNPSLIVGVDASSAAALSLDLASSNNATKGAGQIGYSRALAYANGTVGGKLKEWVSIFDFMSASDVTSFQTTSGTVDVTAAINAAIAALPAVGGILRIPPGGGRISSTITINKPLTIQGSGRENTDGSRLLKTSAVSGPAFLITTSNVYIRDLCLVGQAGNAGDGIVIKQQYWELTNVQVLSMGQDGVRIGDSAVAANSNIGRMTGVLSQANGRHGFYFDEATTNAGGGYYAGCFAYGNTGDGFRLDRAQLNTFVGCVSEENTGIGLNWGDGSRDNWWIVGDSENNTGGNYVKHSNALRCNAIGGWGQVSGAGLGINCRLRNSAAQTIPNATLTALTFDTETYDTDAMHSTTTNTSRITFTTSGPYIITANIGFTANATGFRTIKLRVNNSFDIGYASQPAFASETNTLNLTAQYNFNQGDFVEVIVYQNSGGNLDTVSTSQSMPTFSAMRQN